MKLGTILWLSIFLFITACESINESESAILEPDAAVMAKPLKAQKATGSVEIQWKGKQQSELRRAFAEFDAHAPFNSKPAKGNFVYRVLNEDYTVHREIIVKINAVYIEPATDKGWFTGEVASDSRGCSGNDSGGHSDNCSDSGGCGGGHDDDDPGGHEVSHDDACSGDDGDDHSSGCSGNHGGGSGGQGSMCRTGQILAAKVHDIGSPGTNGDGITWKWFSPDTPNLPAPPDQFTISDWPHLCKKTIIGGNLTVHY
jgi:hypothetical protein